MKIYLCRHGQTTGDVEDRYGGDYDDHLTGLGMQQAQNLATELEDRGIEKVFSSPLARAKETADIVSLKAGCFVELVPKLRERNWYGVLTGMTKDRAQKEFPNQVELLRDYRKTLRGGESYEDFSHRISEGVNEICKAKNKCVAVVTHGGVFKNIFREILKVGEVKKVEDCGYAELEWDGNKFSILNLNGIEMLS